LKEKEEEEPEVIVLDDDDEEEEDVKCKYFKGLFFTIRENHVARQR
jgi:hypothetical protein